MELMRDRASPRLGLWVALALMCLLLVGCNRREMIDKVSFPEDRVLALAAIRDLERGDAAALARKMPPPRPTRIGACASGDARHTANG
jgi:hypothetical protein